MDKQTDRQTDGQTDRQMDGWMDRQTERQAGRQMDGQTDRQTNRQSCVVSDFRHVTLTAFLQSNTQERTPSATQPIPCEKSRRLPTPKPTTEDTDKMENPTFLSSVMRLVSRRKSKRFSEGSLDIEEGIYLNQIDNEEQAAQYFPKVRVELVESKQNESAVVVVSDEKDGVIDSGTSSDQDAATSPLNQSQEIQTEESNQNGDMLSAM